MKYQAKGFKGYVHVLYIVKRTTKKMSNDTQRVSSSASSILSDKSQVKKSSLKVYLSNGRSIARSIGLGDIPDDDGKWITDNYQAIVDAVDKIESKHTQKNKIAALNFMASIFNIDMKTQVALKIKMDTLFKEIQDAYATNEMTDKQKENWVSAEDISAKIKQLQAKILKPDAITDYKEYKSVAKYFMLLFHERLPVRNDLCDVKIVDTKAKTDDTETNYIILNKKKKTATLKLNKYKTFKHHGSKTHDIPLDIVKEIMKYQPIIKKFSPNDWLFPQNENPQIQITRNSYTKYFNDIFKGDGKKVGSTQVRRAIISNVYKPKAHEYKEKQKLADIMGHTVASAQLYYAKVEHNTRIEGCSNPP